MKKLSNIFLIVAATLVLAWFLPWLVGFAVPSASKSQGVYYSPVSDKFVTSRSDDDDGKMKYFELNADGSLSKEVTRFTSRGLLTKTHEFSLNIFIDT